MRREAGAQTELVEWAVAGRAIQGETTSGDLGLVHVVPDRALVAVVDALGHGQAAAEAAALTVKVLERHADESVIALLRLCHTALQGRRGVVMSLASFRPQDSTLTWVGVGNVEGVVVQGDPAATGGKQRVNLVTRGGIVGSELPSLRAEVLPVTSGDVLIFATDGIDGAFWQGLNVDRAPQEIADHVLKQHGKSSDDALVLVARFLAGT